MKKYLLALSLFLMPSVAFAQAQSQPVVVTSTSSTGANTTQPVGNGSGNSTPMPVTCSSGCTGGSTTITAPLGSQPQSASVATTGAVASSVAPTIVGLSTTAAQVLATSTNPVSRTVCNDDATITEYFGPNTVTNAGANGVRLLPGQCWDFSHNTAAIFGVSASATPNARVVQY